jgi:Cys-tRNA(Pro) deacylase
MTGRPDRADLDRLPAVLAACIERDAIALAVIETAEDAPTAEAAARLLGMQVADIVKTMVLTDGTRSVAAIVPGDRRLDRRKVAAALGLRTLRFATADEVVAATGFPPGGVAPLGFANPLSVVVDATLAAEPGREVVAGGGRPELLLRIAVAELILHSEAVVAPIVQDPA